jgi:hypothetical protein
MHWRHASATRAIRATIISATTLLPVDGSLRERVRLRDIDLLMGWASGHIERLRAGETVSFRPRGNSMSGKIESGQLCTVAPVDPESLEVGDIVLCKVNGREYLHLIKAIHGPRFQIGNNRGRINGWISANAIFGKLIAVEE